MERDIVGRVTSVRAVVSYDYNDFEGGELYITLDTIPGFTFVLSAVFRLDVGETVKLYGIDEDFAERKKRGKEWSRFDRDLVRVETPMAVIRKNREVFRLERDQSFRSHGSMAPGWGGHD